VPNDPCIQLRILWRETKQTIIGYESDRRTETYGTRRSDGAWISSTFRDWASETIAYPQEVCEMALAHTIANKVEAAYRRGDLFDKRIKLMMDWASHCNGMATAIQS